MEARHLADVEAREVAERRAEKLEAQQKRDSTTKERDFLETIRAQEEEIAQLKARLQEEKEKTEPLRWGGGTSHQQLLEARKAAVEDFKDSADGVAWAEEQGCGAFFEALKKTKDFVNGEMTSMRESGEIRDISWDQFPLNPVIPTLSDSGGEGESDEEDL